MKHDTAAIGNIKEGNDLRTTVASLQQENATLRTRLEEAKKLVREDTARISERTRLLADYQDRFAMLQAEVLLLKSAQDTDQSDTISVQEAWKAAGGNPGHQATKAELLYNLILLNDVCADLDDPDGDDQSGTSEQQPIAVRAIPRSVVIKAMDGALREFVTVLADGMRAEPSLSLPGQKRLTAYADNLRSTMPLASYVDVAVEKAILQYATDGNSK